MKRESWVSGPHGVRPAGPDDKCFYCKAPVGEQHREDCTIRARTVVLKLEVEFVTDVPEDWTPEQIDFIKNGNTNCASNEMDHLARLWEKLGDDSPCLCDGLSYVREATQDDEATWRWSVDELPS